MHSEKVKNVLKQAGWYEGRNIDISQQLFFLNDLGFKVFDKAIEFFKQYDQLKIPRVYCHNYDGGKSSNDFDHFNVLKIVEYMYVYTTEGEDRERMVRAMCSVKQCDEKVFPIGSLHDMYIRIYITESGKIIDDFSIYGNSIEEGVENIVLGGKKIAAFPEPYEAPEKKKLRMERLKEFMSYIITKLEYSDNRVSWLYKKSASYSVEVKNHLRHIDYAKTLVLIISKVNALNEYLYSFYNFDAKPIFSYYSTSLERTRATGNDIFNRFDKTDSIKIKTNTKILTVADLNFLAYDKRQNTLVILAGESDKQNKILIYDLDGNLIKEILPPQDGYFYEGNIDSMGYITVECNINNDIKRYELRGLDLVFDILSLK